MSVTLTLEAGTVTVPDYAYKSLDGFRRWVRSDAVPDKARTDYYKGKVWIDMSGKEQVFSHGRLKSQLGAALVRLVEGADLGYLWINGVLVSNTEADLSGNPDVTFVSFAAMEAGRVELVEGATEGYTELRGVPDLVVEVVSPSTARKDADVLRQAYWETGIPEYWIADGRGEAADLTILKRTAKGYSEVRKTGGWLKSAVLGRSFRLTRTTDRLGHPSFTLDVK